MSRFGHLLPEWASVKTVLMAWPYPDSDWRETLAQAQACYWLMLAEFSARVHVTVLLHPSLSLTSFEQQFSKHNINTSRVTVINHIEYNDTWIRDYGPLSMNNGYQTFVFNGWGGKYNATADNAVASSLTKYIGPVEVSNFVLEGGALETNGDYLLLNADCIVDENRNEGMSFEKVEEFLARELGISKILWIKNVCLKGDDTDGHIDTLARFAPGKKIVYAGPNPSHGDHSTLCNLQEQIFRHCEKLDFEALALPSPIINSAVDGRQLPATYANFLLANSTLFAPIYGVEEDEQAIEVLSAAYPNFGIVPIRCEALLEQHGSLHCATMQIAEISEA